VIITAKLFNANQCTQESNLLSELFLTQATKRSFAKLTREQQKGNKELNRMQTANMQLP